MDEGGSRSRQDGMWTCGTRGYTSKKCEPGERWAKHKELSTRHPHREMADFFFVVDCAKEIKYNWILLLEQDQISRIAEDPRMYFLM
jgi:hypothetical protein